LVLIRKSHTTLNFPLSRRRKGNSYQPFTDHFEQADYSVEDLLDLELNSNRARASFIAGLNAIFRYLSLCAKTVHCKDDEPQQCALQLPSVIETNQKILLVGFQPRFLQTLASIGQVRVIDLDQENIGKKISSIMIESSERTSEAIDWCDLIFATGSTVVNGTITNFLTKQKLVLFYGVSISAAAKILNLKTYCHCGH